jgi:hypothetical protein
MATATTKTTTRKKNEMSETRYTQELADEICRRISEGTPLRQVCRELDGAPPESTVRQWVTDNRNGFAADYRRARLMQIECWADEIVLISNRNDLDPQDKRVRIDTLKFLLSKIAPRQYGDRLLVAGEPENPVRVLHQQIALDALSAEQLEALECLTMTLLAEPR